MAKGHGTPGQRAAPSKTTSNDAKIGSRLDNAELFQKDGKTYKRFKWQLNKNVENSTLKKLAAKNSHKVWSFADMEVKDEVAERQAKNTIDDIFIQLERNLEDE